MKKITSYIRWTSYIFLAVVLILQSCSFDDEGNLNDPVIGDLGSNASKSQLNAVMVGTLSAMRDRIDTYLDDVGVIGREYYRFSGADPRFTSDLLGAGEAVLDNNTFYINNPWQSRYRTVRNTNILIDGVNNTNLITAAEAKGYLGVAKTLQANELLMNLNLTDENGIRINVKDPLSLGPIVNKTDALAAIASLLNEADTDLSAAGDVFAFNLGAGFDGFNTPANFRKVNRALAARVAAYRGQWTEAKSNLEASFLDKTGNWMAGAYHIFSGSTNDQLNKAFYPLNNTGELRATQPSFISNAEAGDTRLAKAPQRAEEAAQSELKSSYDVWVYTSNAAPIAIIRNEELALLYAETMIHLNDNNEAVNTLNTIRVSHGLGAYSGGVTTDELINEMLKQRRYSLFAEGHRWIDMRRYGKLGELPIDRAEDDVWSAFPIPITEN